MASQSQALKFSGRQHVRRLNMSRDNIIESVRASERDSHLIVPQPIEVRSVEATSAADEDRKKSPTATARWSASPPRSSAASPFANGNFSRWCVLVLSSAKQTGYVRLRPSHGGPLLILHHRLPCEPK